MYDIRSPPPGRVEIVVGNGRRLRVECFGSVDTSLHGHTSVRRTLSDASYVSELGFNLYSLHAIRRTHVIIYDASGVPTPFEPE